VRPGAALVGLAALAKREDLADHRPELAGVGELGQPGKLRGVRGDHEGHRVDAGLFSTLRRRRGAERHQPAAAPGEAVGCLKHRPAPADLEFARIWKAIPKVVFSTTLASVQGNARLAEGDAAYEIARLKAEPGEGVVSVGCAGFASTLIELDLIDEYRLFTSPVLLGGGTPLFPPLNKRIDLELIEMRTFGSRVIYARYQRVRQRPGPLPRTGP
jgi:RibD C-terminal domain